MTFGYVPDLEVEEFDLFTCVSWTHLIFFGILEVLLIGKCVFEKLQQIMTQRDLLISVEVLSKDKPIDRKRAKKNMHQVLLRCESRKDISISD